MNFGTASTKAPAVASFSLVDPAYAKAVRHGLSAMEATPVIEVGEFDAVAWGFIYGVDPAMVAHRIVYQRKASEPTHTTWISFRLG